jgi:hypothetical protein
VSLRPIICAYCGAASMKEVGAVNRSIRSGLSLYCDRRCSGLGRRNPNPPSEAERRNAKAEYDRRRRAELGDALLAKKRAAYHAKVAADSEAVRAKQRAYRQQNMARHVEYCRRPEYRKWKAQYDRSYCARKDFGPFADAALLLRDLEREISSRASRYEIYSTNGTLNKWLNRRRDYEKIISR